MSTKRSNIELKRDIVFIVPKKQKAVIVYIATHLQCNKQQQQQQQQQCNKQEQ
jgi:hypothetical protein